MGDAYKDLLRPRGGRMVRSVTDVPPWLRAALAALPMPALRKEWEKLPEETVAAVAISSMQSHTLTALGALEDAVYNATSSALRSKHSGDASGRAFTALGREVLNSLIMTSCAITGCPPPMASYAICAASTAPLVPIPFGTVLAFAIEAVVQAGTLILAPTPGLLDVLRISGENAVAFFPARTRAAPAQASASGGGGEAAAKKSELGDGIAAAMAKMAEAQEKTAELVAALARGERGRGEGPLARGAGGAREGGAKERLPQLVPPQGDKKLPQVIKKFLESTDVLGDPTKSHRPCYYCGEVSCAKKGSPHDGYYTLPSGRGISILEARAHVERQFKGKS